jgi:hypothetical protein
MLSVKNSQKLFYRIDLSLLNKLDDETKETINHINTAWADIEYLNYLFHKNFSDLTDEDEDTSILFEALIAMSNFFYIHLSTIYLLMKKNSKKYSSINKLLLLNKKYLENRVQIIRNCILVHKEKNFYRKALFSVKSTDASHLIEHEMIVCDNEDNKTKHTLKPLKDINTMFKLLNNFEDLLRIENEKLL